MQFFLHYVVSFEHNKLKVPQKFTWEVSIGNITSLRLSKLLIYVLQKLYSSYSAHGFHYNSDFTGTRISADYNAQFQ